MITIIHILADANLSGAPLHVLSLTKGLDKQQFRSLVICPPGPVVKEFEKEKVTVSQFSFTSKWQWHSVSLLRNELIALTEDQKQVIIHCHGVRAGLFGRLATRSLPFPVVYTEHSWTKDYWLPNPLNGMTQLTMLRFLDHYTDVTIGVSEAVTSFLLKKHITHSAKLKTIYNGIDLSKKPLPLLNNQTIGSIGSLTWQKNYLFLLDVITEVKKVIPEIRLEIIGEGPEHEKIKEKITASKLQKNVFLLESKPHHELTQHHKNWSLYVQCSTNESFGLALAEAIAAGLPAVGTEVGSIPEIVSDRTATFPCGEVNLAASVIIDLLQDKNKREKLHQKQLAAVSKFTISKMVSAHQQLYKDLINKT